MRKYAEGIADEVLLNELSTWNNLEIIREREPCWHHAIAWSSAWPARRVGGQGTNKRSFVRTIHCMEHSVYILYSFKIDRFYVGQTINLKNRLAEHNSGESPNTSMGIPWSLVWSTSKDTFGQLKC
jgi:hypothetical protein